MVGFPKHLNTKEDYMYIKENFPTEQWKPYWQALLAESKNWFCVGTLKSKDEGMEDSTHKIVESESMDGGTEYYQYEYKDDPASDFFRLGFTKKEVSAALK